MKFKKLISLTIAATLLSTTMVGCGNKSNNTTDNNNKNEYSVSMITDVAGVNDHSFNQSAWEGLQRAEKEIGVTVKY